MAIWNGIWLLPIIVLIFAVYYNNKFEVISSSQFSILSPTTYVVYNASIWMSTNKKATCFSVIGARFDQVEEGDKCEELRKRYPTWRTFNMNGKLVVPGLIDSHAHLLGLGDALTIVDLKPAKSVKEVRELLIASINKQTTTDTWIFGHGWDQTKYSNDAVDFPSASDLEDSILSKFFISLSRVDYHAFWVNQRVLDSLTDVPEVISGGEIVRKDGNMTGIFVDNAMKLISDIIPPNSEKAILNRLKKANEKLLSLGITSIHDAGVSPSQLRLLRKAELKNTLKIRNYAMVMCEDDTVYCGDDVLPELIYSPTSSENLENKKILVKGVKLVLDGALGSWGAAMIEV
ncbi:hypothetical protein HK098_004485 [Nowakowskiella sp. JEL0407]|nr:hypothetical protein HK098_004485 [Nowakowskiella sp. JEL0407]